MTQLLNYLDPTFIVQTLGLAGVLAVVFAESGLLFGFIFPGDSLLVTAGILAAAGYLNIWWLAIGGFVAAVAGDSVGYAFGKRLGPTLFRKEDSRFFKKAYLYKTEQFYVRHGKKALVLARFMPIVRTFAPILAGVARMPYRDFFLYNVIGALAWATGLSLVGYLLGALVPDVERYLLIIIALIVLTSFIPLLREKFKTRL
jgi:membrane-associated protein